MNIPKEIKTYCQGCNSHEEHKLKHFKPASARTMAWSTRQNKRKHKKGYGGKAEFIAKVKKQNKKPTFLKECKKCNRKGYFVIPKRMKKVELN